jgi:molybdopterin molybdotransferase
MIRFEKAIELIASSSFRMGQERIDLKDATGRILAVDVFSDIDMPPFDKSAVDGYACRKEDLGSQLAVIEVIAAGKVPEKSISIGQCTKIMTGGMVPKGADTVIMVEDVMEISPGIIRFTGEKASANIAFKAEDIRRGEFVVRKGRRIRPQDIAVLASVGCFQPYVVKKPGIGIISTGDELVEPDRFPSRAQIRNSNAWQLMSQAEKAGCKVSYYGIAADSEEATHEKIISAMLSNDIIVLTGGISVGDFDFVPAIVQKAGFDIKFHSLAVQPGKPSLFAVKGNQFLFGLPGNPVSSFVQFELLVGALLKTMTGNNDQDRVLTLTLGADLKRKKSERKSFIPVKITGEGMVVPVEYHGSAHINSFVDADGIVSIEIGQTEICKGTAVHVRLL